MKVGTRTLAVLQWAGLLGGAAAMMVEHLVGYWSAEAECGGPGAAEPFGNDAWFGALAGAAAVLVVLAAAAALVVLRRTRPAEPGDGPLEDQPLPREPCGRLHFFSAAALTANIVFLGVIALDGLGATLTTVCRQA
jgi:hypothetical protein